MIVVAGMLLGIVAGILTARRHGGRWLDMLQFAIAFAIAFAIVALFVTLVVGRLA